MWYMLLHVTIWPGTSCQRRFWSQICSQNKPRSAIRPFFNLYLPAPTVERATSSTQRQQHRNTGTAAARWHSPSAARTRQPAPAATGSSSNVDQVGYYDTAALLAQTCTPAHTHPELLLLLLLPPYSPVHAACTSSTHSREGYSGHQKGVLGYT